MPISTLLFLLVVIFALFVILTHAVIEPWWGLLALAIACLIGGYLGDRRL